MKTLFILLLSTLNAHAIGTAVGNRIFGLNDSQLASRNYVRNPSASKSAGFGVTWTNVTAGRNTSSVTIPDANAEFSFTIDSSSDTVEWTVNTFPDLTGSTCTAAIHYTSASAAVKFQVRRNSATVAETTLSATSKPQYVQLPFDCGDAVNSTTVRIAGIDSTSTAMKVARVSVNVPGAQQAIINTGGEWVGSIKWVGKASCAWNRVSDGSFADFSEDLDCNSPTVSGQVTAPLTKVPAAVVTMDPNYVYRFIALGEVRSASTSNACAWRFYDGATASAVQVTGYPTADIGFPQIEGEISPATSGSKTVALQATGAFGNTACYIEASKSGFRELQINVYKFPKSSSVTANIMEAGDYNWTEYTPTVQGLSSLTATKYEHMRIGGNLFLRFKFTPGATSATEVRVSLPTGLTISSGVTARAVVGWGGREDNSTDSFYSMNAEGGQTYVAFGRIASTVNSLSRVTGSAHFGTQAYSFFSGPIPIQGWSTFPFAVGSVDNPGRYGGFTNSSSTSYYPASTGSWLTATAANWATKTFLGVGTAPGTSNDYAFKIASLPAGTYEVCTSAQVASLQGATCGASIFDGTTRTATSMADSNYGSASVQDNVKIGCGIFKYTSEQSNIEFKLQIYGNSTTGCRVFTPQSGSSGENSFYIRPFGPQ